MKKMSILLFLLSFIFVFQVKAQFNANGHYTSYEGFVFTNPNPAPLMWVRVTDNTYKLSADGKTLMPVGQFDMVYKIEHYQGTYRTLYAFTNTSPDSDDFISIYNYCKHFFGEPDFAQYDDTTPISIKGAPSLQDLLRNPHHSLAITWDKSKQKAKISILFQNGNLTLTFDE